jgi:hypothetical protein
MLLIHLYLKQIEGLLCLGYCIVCFFVCLFFLYTVATWIVDLLLLAVAKAKKPSEESTAIAAKDAPSQESTPVIIVISAATVLAVTTLAIFRSIVGHLADRTLDPVIDGTDPRVDTRVRRQSAALSEGDDAHQFSVLEQWTTTVTLARTVFVLWSKITM